MQKSRSCTERERAEARARQREQVEQSVRELLTSDGWRRWAETRAKFHDYSIGNCLLISMQCPDATQVAGFRRWQELGRQVRKGEKAIRILAPMVVGGSKDDRSALRKAGQVMQPTSGDKMGAAEGPRILFKSVPVFDVGQTYGEPLPDRPCQPITGDSHERYLRPLRELAGRMGVTVGIETITSAARGYYDVKARHIVVDGDQPVNAQVRTLVHELAHAHGVTYTDYSRGEAEVIAETAATIVCSGLGLDTSGASVPYIAGWGESGDLAAIRKHAETVDAIARSIESACGLMKGA